MVPSSNSCITITFLMALSLMITIQLISFAIWPSCKDGAPCEQRETLPQRARSFAREVVPPLKAYKHNLAQLGTSAWVEKGRRDCVTPFVNWLENELGGFVSSPTKIKEVTARMAIDKMTIVRKAIGELWTTPTNYSHVVRQSVSCALGNPELVEYMCSALDDPALRPTLIRTDALSLAMHLYLVLEKVASAGRDDSALYAALSQQFERISDQVVGNIAQTTRNVGDSEEVKNYRVQQWLSISLSPDNQLALKERPLQHAKWLQYLMMINILEAAYTEQLLGVEANVDVALALANDVSAQRATVDEYNHITWPFGEDWLNAYNAWMINHASQFGDITLFAKLAIPSILCASTDDVPPSIPGWRPPDPSSWYLARAISLKAMMVFQYNLKVQMQATGKPWPSSIISSAARKEWAEITRSFSKLPRPSECCGKGSLKEMWDHVKPYDALALSPAGELPMEWFTFYRTLVLWTVVVLAGFGSELIVGANLLTYLSVDKSMVLWKFFQLVFSGCLTIALFSQSAFGLPFLWIGLWKGGFPESSGYIVASLEKFKTSSYREALSDLLNALGVIVHHSSTSLIICSTFTGLFPLSRPLLTACIVPVLQHCCVLIKYFSVLAYTAIQLVLEFYFEWEVISNLSLFESSLGYDFTRFGRGCALAMLFSHWLYLLGAALLLSVPEENYDEHAGGMGFTSTATGFKLKGSLAIMRGARVFSNAYIEEQLRCERKKCATPNRSMINPVESSLEDSYCMVDSADKHNIVRFSPVLPVIMSQDSF